MDYDLSWLVGRAIAEIDRLENCWRFKFVPEAEIIVECPWRIVRNACIAISSEDHGHQYGLTQPIDSEIECQAMVGESVVKSAEVRSSTRDIVIVFETGIRLEVIPLSSGYESWQVTGPDGILTIAQGGGNLVVWNHNTPAK